MPAHARCKIVRLGEVGIYHCWSRVIQSEHLCGVDPVTGKDYDYRRKWIEDLLAYLASVFAGDVGTFNVLSNHHHAVVRPRPDLVGKWSDEEVALRWKLAWPELVDGQWVREVFEQDLAELLVLPGKIPWIRQNLSSLSWLMARWKEPIARLCNAESSTSGHFWADRFGSRELLDESAVVACSAYVELNQLKAGMIDQMVDSRHAAIRHRIQAAQAREVAESMKSFRTGCDPAGYPLSEETLANMFADCWLAPIAEAAEDVAPPEDRMVTARIVVDPRRPLVRDQRQTASAEEESVPESPVADKPAEAAVDAVSPVLSDEESDKAQVEEATSASVADPATAGPDERPRSRIVERPCRVSRDPILGIPWQQYQAVAQVAAVRLAVAMGDLDPWLSRLSTEMLATLTERGLNPAGWLRHLDELAEACRCAMGSARRMEEQAREQQRHWYRGVGVCREAFLDGHT